MITLSTETRFFLELTKTQSVLSRRLDARLGGISLNWFIIMFHLSQAPDEQMRRIDLADKVGLTASGITRLLGPMEKIGLVKSKASEHDGRVSHISLASGGKTKLIEAVEDLELFAEEVIPEGQRKTLANTNTFLAEIAAKVK